MKTYTVPFLLVLCGLAAASCSTAKIPERQLSPEQHAELERLRALPSTFQAPRDSLRVYQDRARAFIVKYGGIGIQFDEEWRIQSFMPNNNCGFMYRAKWVVVGESIEVTVECATFCLQPSNPQYCPYVKQLAKDN